MNNLERRYTKSQVEMLERLSGGETVFGGYLERTRLNQLGRMGVVRRIANKRVMDTVSFEKWELTDVGVSLIVKLGLMKAEIEHG